MHRVRLSLFIILLLLVTSPRRPLSLARLLPGVNNNKHLARSLSLSTWTLDSLAHPTRHAPGPAWNTQTPSQHCRTILLLQPASHLVAR